LSLEFKWDSRKAASNRKKHGVDFAEARTVFNDPYHGTLEDEAHSLGEVRFVTVGRSSSGRILVVAHTEDDEAIRIISARLATKAEAQGYEWP
jgi:uncharacterized DUF497 family protein